MRVPPIERFAGLHRACRATRSRPLRKKERARSRDSLGGAVRDAASARACKLCASMCGA
jgi:hypothetical protein